MKHFFQLTERNTSYKQETLAGLTTFLSIAYILIVNPLILSQAGMEKGAVFTATALTAIIGSLLIGILSNYPIAIAPSMGLNSFFTFSVCIGMGIAWPVALTGVFIASILFVLLSLLKIREKIINIIPSDLKHAIASGTHSDHISDSSWDKRRNILWDGSHNDSGDVVGTNSHSFFNRWADSQP